jgi:Protein of unknown function (DUF4058)
MPSPFPGMDPWLEAADVFPDLHESLIFLIKGELNALLPAGYVATSKNRVWVDEVQSREPDVSVLGTIQAGSGGTAVLPGLTVIDEEFGSDPVEESYLEIYSMPGKRLVTAIEVISLTNKHAGKRKRKPYLLKQKEYHKGRVNLVEIDLLRAGPHVTLVSRDRLERKVGSFDYHISVRTEHPASRLFAAGIKLAAPLPSLAVPLDQNAGHVMVDLQKILDQAYESGRYERLVDYTTWCDPPLPAAQRKWAEAILREKGLLPATAAPGS